jgi:hypothetical protein
MEGVMAISSVLFGIVAVTICSLSYMAGVYHGQRRADMTRRPIKLELKDLAAKTGVELDFTTFGKTWEGSKLLDAMIQCEDCESTEACRFHIQTENQADSRLTTFCPNAVYLLGLAAGRRAPPIAAQGI